MRKIITRAEAKAQGLERYFTGRPCKRGHVCERLAWGHCVKCLELFRDKWRAANPEKFRESNRKSQLKRRVADLEKARAKDRASRLRRINPDYVEKTRARCAQYRADNPEQWREQWRKSELKIELLIEGLSQVGLIRKGDTKNAKRALLREYRKLGIIKKGDLDKWIKTKT